MATFKQCLMKTTCYIKFYVTSKRFLIKKV